MKHFVQSIQPASSSAWIQIQICVRHIAQGCTLSHCLEKDLIIRNWKRPCMRGYPTVYDTFVHPPLRISPSL